MIPNCSGTKKEPLPGISDRNGYFAEADGGTIFLDEVGELPLSTQARLLRVLESGEYIKVGSSKVQKTNVRIVAATNVDFSAAIADGRFREDLYYRLNTVPIKVLPLRERPDDIVLLFRKFASDFGEKYHMPAIQLTEEAKQMLVHYPWYRKYPSVEKHYGADFHFGDKPRHYSRYIAELSASSA